MRYGSIPGEKDDLMDVADGIGVCCSEHKRG